MQGSYIKLTVDKIRIENKPFPESQQFLFELFQTKFLEAHHYDSMIKNCLLKHHLMKLG